MAVERLNALVNEVEEGLRSRRPHLHAAVEGHEAFTPLNPPYLRVEVRGDDPSPRFWVRVNLTRGYDYEPQEVPRLIDEIARAAEDGLRDIDAGRPLDQPVEPSIEF